MKCVAIDANLLLLLLVGETSRGAIAKHKRLRQYDVDAFDLLCELLEEAAEIIVTPHVLAEVSNLAVYGVSEPLRGKIMDAMRLLIERASEVYSASVDAVRRVEFNRLGLTDTIWLSVIDPKCTFLTDDLRLYLAASSAGVDVKNFTHLRAERGLI